MLRRLAPGPAFDLAHPGEDGNNAMPSETRMSSMVRGQLLGVLRFPALITASVLVLLAALLVVVAYRGLVRFEPVHEHIAHLRLLEDAVIAAERALAETPPEDESALSSRLDKIRPMLARLTAAEHDRLQQASTQWQTIERGLTDESVPPRQRLESTASMLLELLSSEQRAQALLLETTRDTARFEFELAAVMLFALPITAIVMAYLLRHRVWRPLADLALLLNELSIREYRRIPEEATRSASPTLETVYKNYNTLVSRLRALEDEHQRRENTLEEEVREATSALLDLNRQLAESERLAAVGALSAGLAHELRNPLAGIRMACERLRETLADPAQAERLSMVLDEIDRLNQLLSAQLGMARHAPEAASDVGMKECVDSLLSLLRYQVPECVRLRSTVPDDARCRLPVGQLRQTLLNLVLNAAQAIGDAAGSIEVAVRRDEDALVVSVTDDGPGFPPEVMSAPARAFVTSREGGTGLGLATVRRFAADLGGRIHLENVAPHGARVSLVIPCGANHA